MIKRNADTKADFRFLKENQTRSIMSKFVKNEQLCDDLVNLVEEETVTAFQLKDLMRVNHSYDSIKAAIIEQVNKKKLLNVDPRVLANEMGSDDETEEEQKKRKEDEKKKKYGMPTYNIEQLFKETGCIVEKSAEELKKASDAKEAKFAELKEASRKAIYEAQKEAEPEEKKSEEDNTIDTTDKAETKKEEPKKEEPKKEDKKEIIVVCPLAKMKELNIDNEMFWGLDEAMFKDTLEIKDFGPRKKLLKRIAEIKEEHEELIEQKEIDSKRLSADDKTNMQILLKTEEWWLF